MPNRVNRHGDGSDTTRTDASETLGDGEVEMGYWILNTKTGATRRRTDGKPAAEPTIEPRTDSNTMTHDPKTIAHLDALAALGTPRNTITGNGVALQERSPAYIEARHLAAERARSDADKFATVPRDDTDREDGGALRWDTDTGALIGVDSFRTDQSKRTDDARAEMIRTNRSAWTKDPVEAKLHNDSEAAGRRGKRADAPVTDDVDDSESDVERAKRLRAAAGDK